MKKAFSFAALATVSFVALASVSSASASDLPSKKNAPTAPAVAPSYNWSGPYLGVQGGYTFSSDVTGTLSSYSSYVPQATGQFGGLFGGYNFQSGSIVYGGELDFSLANVEDTKSTSGGGLTLKIKTSQSRVGAARVRLGYAFDNILVFAAAGVAHSDGKISMAIASPALNVSESDKKDFIGFTVGGGVEYGVSKNLATKIEYRYSSYQTQTFGTTKIGFDTHDVRAGVAYKF